MSCFAFAVGTITPGAGTADGSQLTTGTYMAIVSGSAAQTSFVDEIYMGGQAASTAPLIMLLRHDSTLGATPATLVTPNSNGPSNPNAGILTNPAVGFVAATTQPTPSSSITIAKKNFTFNAFGGIVRANYANTQDRYGIFGTATTVGELSLSSFTGSTVGAAIGAHIIYETL